MSELIMPRTFLGVLKPLDKFLDLLQENAFALVGVSVSVPFEDRFFAQNLG